MKALLRVILVLAVVFWGEVEAHALRAEHFRGVYEILAEHSKLNEGEPPPTKLLFVDNDTVGNIWSHWADGDLPSDLEKYRHEPALLVGFNFRDALFFTLEESTLIGPRHMAVPGSGGDLFEIRYRSDGHYDVGVKEKGSVLYYEVGPKEPLPF